MSADITFHSFFSSFFSLRYIEGTILAVTLDWMLLNRLFLSAHYYTSFKLAKPIYVWWIAYNLHFIYRLLIVFNKMWMCNVHIQVSNIRGLHIRRIVYVHAFLHCMQFYHYNCIHNYSALCSHKYKNVEKKLRILFVCSVHIMWYRRRVRDINEFGCDFGSKKLLGLKMFFNK